LNQQSINILHCTVLRVDNNGLYILVRRRVWHAHTSNRSPLLQAGGNLAQDAANLGFGTKGCVVFGVRERSPCAEGSATVGGFLHDCFMSAQHITLGAGVKGAICATPFVGKNEQENVWKRKPARTPTLASTTTIKWVHVKPPVVYVWPWV
jgi:hypothetical protein